LVLEKIEIFLFIKGGNLVILFFIRCNDRKKIIACNITTLSYNDLTRCNDLCKSPDCLPLKVILFFIRYNDREKRLIPYIAIMCFNDYHDGTTFIKVSVECLSFKITYFSFDINIMKRHDSWYNDSCIITTQHDGTSKSLDCLPFKVILFFIRYNDHEKRMTLDITALCLNDPSRWNDLYKSLGCVFRLK